MPEGLIIKPISNILLLVGKYVGWNIGANDTANCIGPKIRLFIWRW
jgi:phosphate/sulfate permease